MKKFYLGGAITFIFICIAGFAKAQTTYTTITGSGFLLSNASSWIGAAPPNPCSNCKIIIQGDAILDAANGTVVINGGSEIDVLANASLEVDTYVQLTNSTVLVGSDGTNPASVLINDEVDVSNTTIRLANISTSIDASNPSLNPVSGPIGSNPGISGVAGLVYVTNAGTFPAIGSYNYLLSSGGYGDVTFAPPVRPGTPGVHHFFDPYTINCEFFPPVSSPNICSDNSGVVYGPAITMFVVADGLLEFVQDATLPVLLVQFTASRNSDNTNKISWTTSQEINSGYFGVERSADGNSWQTLGTVRAKGFSSIAVDYTYTDAYPLEGVNYYRLKMVDLDGKFKYTKVISVSSGDKTESLVVYNNPFTDQIRVKVNIKAADNLVLTVTDMLGRSYISKSYNAQAGDNFINLNPTGALPGTYILRIQGNKFDRTVKLIKE